MSPQSLSSPSSSFPVGAETAAAASTDTAVAAVGGGVCGLRNRRGRSREAIMPLLRMRVCVACAKDMQGFRVYILGFRVCGFCFRLRARSLTGTRGCVVRRVATTAVPWFD